VSVYSCWGAALGVLVYMLFAAITVGEIGQIAR
jgi:hypothetical protein